MDSLAALKIVHGGYGGVGTRDIDKLLAIKLSSAARLLYLPEYLEPGELLTAAAEGGPLVLPFDEGDVRGS